MQNGNAAHWSRKQSYVNDKIFNDNGNFRLLNCMLMDYCSVMLKQDPY